MSGLCAVCGLPKELCVCKKIMAEQEEITIREFKKKFKMVTDISGIDPKEVESMAKDLKKELACGGTAKDNIIELQGRHTRKARAFLIKRGFSPKNIKS
ncbi:MAG: stress response translation initiation inhibitor YciH [Candidatus ainarchaeum sp.]|nr:stress response translation initiation inhibitor YciH [Candidatus ainarchaeum sp.]